jgi:hypothetical protein
MPDIFDIQQVAKSNSGVEPDKVTEALEIKRMMVAAGVFRQAEYQIAPPLGGSYTRHPAPRFAISRTTTGTRLRRR